MAPQFTARFTVRSSCQVTAGFLLICSMLFAHQLSAFAQTDPNTDHYNANRVIGQWVQKIQERPVRTVTATIRRTSGGKDTFINLRFQGEETFENGKRVYLNDNREQSISWDISGEKPNGKPLVLNAYEGRVQVNDVTVTYDPSSETARTSPPPPPPVLKTPPERDSDRARNEPPPPRRDDDRYSDRDSRRYPPIPDDVRPGRPGGPYADDRDRGYDRDRNDDRDWRRDRDRKLQRDNDWDDRGDRRDRDRRPDNYDRPSNDPKERCHYARVAPPKIEVSRVQETGGLFSGKYRVQGAVEGMCVEEAGYYENGELIQSFEIPLNDFFDRAEFTITVHTGRSGEIRIYATDGSRDVITIDDLVSKNSLF